LVVAVAAGAVVAGDFLGHRTGRLLGDRLRTGRIARRIPTAAWQHAEALMARRGGQALFFSRFAPVLRTLTPHVAGATHVLYRRIAPQSALATPLWAGAEAGTGYAAAASLHHVLVLGAPALALTAAAAAGAAVAWGKARRGVGYGTSDFLRAPRAPWWTRVPTGRRAAWPWSPPGGGGADRDGRV
jgi:membrane-associated protein